MMRLLIVAVVLAHILLGGWTIAHADTTGQRVLAMVYEPLMPDGRTIAQAQGWQPSWKLTDGLVDALGRAGRDYWIVERRTVNDWAPGAYPMTPDNWRLFCGGSGRWYVSPVCYYQGRLDVETVLRQADIPVDEIWLVLPPYLPECLEFYATSPRILVINQERRLAEALESYSHMEEAQRGLHDMQGPVHRPPGSVRAYQYDGPGCAVWGCNQVGYLEWWLSSVAGRL